MAVIDSRPLREIPAGTPAGNFSQTRPTLRQWQTNAEEIRPLFHRQREAAADEVDKFAVGLELQRLQLAASRGFSRLLFSGWWSLLHEGSFPAPEARPHPLPVRRIACCE